VLNLFLRFDLPLAFDPLNNPGTSRVLFELIITGPTTPTQLAKILDVEPPSIIDQLVRLRKIQLVHLGRKEGKEQRYEPDWKMLVEVGVGRAFQPSQPDMKEDASVGAIITQFLENSVFREFFKTYLERRLAETPFELIVARNWTFAQLVEDFHTTLVGMLSDQFFLEAFNVPQKNEQLTSLYRDLMLWRDSSLHVPDISRRAFVQALQKQGFEIYGLPKT